MPGFLQQLVANETDFFISFQKQADNIVAGVAAFTTMLETLLRCCRTCAADQRH